MTQFRITNSKGLFFQAGPRGLATLPVIEHIREVVIPSILDEKERAQAIKALQALEALPVIEAVMMRCAHDGATGYGPVKCRGWISPGLAQSESNNPIDFGSPQDAGWLAIEQAYKLRPQIERLVFMANAPIIYPFQWNGASTIKKKIGEAIFIEVDRAAANAESEAFVMHVYGQGFLDASGSTGPLARARMFESAQAAARTAKSRRLPQWKVVSVSVALGACVDLPGDSNSEALSASIALQEAKALDQALEKAGVDRLRAKLAELEAADTPKEKKQSSRL